MMKILHCVIIMLNILLISGHVGSKQNLQHLRNENNLENIKAIAERLQNGAEESNNASKNGIKNIGIVPLINALRGTNKDKKPYGKNVGKRLSNDDAVLVYDIESGRPLGRSRPVKIATFLRKLYVYSWHILRILST